MAELSYERRWLVWVSYVGLCLLILLVQLLPLNTAPTWWAAPDFFLALTLAWVIRRPDYAPLSLVVLMALLGDLLLHRPPGLWTALAVLGLEVLRARADAIREGGPAIEMVFVTLVCVGLAAAYRLVLLIFLLPAPGFVAQMSELLGTLVVYPVVALGCQIALRPSRRPNTETEVR